jgi:hypothetical protein
VAAAAAHTLISFPEKKKHQQEQETIKKSGENLLAICC